jgi:pyruvate formate lyase activating enzyme
VRVNEAGQLKTPWAGWVTSLALDPIEKKPLYHFHPGSHIFSVGFASCNFRCPFCQNWSISQTTDAPGKSMSTTELVGAALRHNPRDKSIAFTYSEPLVHIEYLLEALAAAKKAGLATVLVTNGCINEEPARQVLALTDAANVDLKCYDVETYKKLGGDLDTVKNFISLGCSLGVHIEVTTLLVPGINDKDEELAGIARFLGGLAVAGLDKAPPPWHITAYYPAWNYHQPPTSRAAVLKAVEQARKTLPYVHSGNI